MKTDYSPILADKRFPNFDPVWFNLFYKIMLVFIFYLDNNTKLIPKYA